VPTSKGRGGEGWRGEGTGGEGRGGRKVFPLFLFYEMTTDTQTKCLHKIVVLL